MIFLEQAISSLQKHLKSAENLLAQSLYHAKEKLKSFDRANQGLFIAFLHF